jgi:transcriptional regulator with XRE-family HTH domain
MTEPTEQDLADNIAENFRYIRTQLQWTQKQMAEALQTTRSRIGSIEEKRATSYLMIYRIAKFTKVSMDTIICTKMNG